MALTSTVIANSSDHLEDVTKALLITLFRQSDVYRQHALIFNLDLPARIDAAEGTIKARMLNAVISEIDKLGIGEVEIRGDDDAVWWSQSKERDALIKTAFLVLYDDIVDSSSPTTNGVIPTLGLYGDFAIGQRPNYIDRFGDADAPFSRFPCVIHSTFTCGCRVYRAKSYPF